jgi:hypothetical protein
MIKRAQKFFAEAIVVCLIALAMAEFIEFFVTSDTQSKAESMTAHLTQEWRR